MPRQIRGPWQFTDLMVQTAAGNVALVNEAGVNVNKTSGAATAVTLPPAPSTGRTVLVKDGKGDAATNAITISGAAGATIDGAATLVIGRNRGGAILQYNGTEWSVLSQFNSGQVDQVSTSPLKWVDVAVTAALLDGAGTVNVVAGVAGTQWKVRQVILVGGGTSFGAAGDRLIGLTDGTTTWTTIANADIETAPAASLMWGNAKVPFLTGTSNTASVAGQAVRFAYSGGTTDHVTGSITFSVCLEKVA